MKKILLSCVLAAFPFVTQDFAALAKSPDASMQLLAMAGKDALPVVQPFAPGAARTPTYNQLKCTSAEGSTFRSSRDSFRAAIFAPPLYTDSSTDRLTLLSLT